MRDQLNNLRGIRSDKKQQEVELALLRSDSSRFSFENELQEAGRILLYNLIASEKNKSIPSSTIRINYAMGVCT